MKKLRQFLVGNTKTLWPMAVLPLLAAGLLLGQTQQQRGLALSQDNIPVPYNGISRWTGTRLAGCDHCVGGDALLWTADRQGYGTSVDFVIPGADYQRVRDVAAGPDGSITAVGFAMSGDNRSGTFIAWISPDATRQVVTRVWPYSPEAVATAADGTIWTAGPVMNDSYRVVYPNVLRHYATSGQLLASTVVRGVRPSSGGVYVVSQNSALMVSGDRVGWLTMACQYIEFSLDAVQLGNYACPSGYTKTQSYFDVAGVALSSSDDLLLGGQWGAPLAPLELDRATNTWNPVPVYKDSGKTLYLLGFDGLTLVTSQSSGMRRYTWSGQPPAGGQ